MTQETWPVEDLESVPNCPVCGGLERTPLYEDLTDRVFGVAPGKWTLYRCVGCESAWLDPRPDQPTIGRAYESYFTHVAEDDISLQPKSRLVRQLHAWLNDYKNAKFGLRRAPAGFGGRWLVPLIPSLRAKANAQCRHLPRLPAAGGRLLDVGFGNGGFLKLASEMGWDAEGIDFDSKAVEMARGRGLNVRCASANELFDQDEKYDVITISHVIEHVYDPVTLLKDLYCLLKPGGLLWLETPNLSSRGATRFGRDWMALDPPRHLVLFNPESLRMSLRRAGFSELIQHWQGMVSFSMYTVSAAIAQGQYGKDAFHNLIPPTSAIMAEVMEMVSSGRREYLTFSAYKPL